MERAGSRAKGKVPRRGSSQWQVMYCPEVVEDRICNAGFRTVSAIKQHIRLTGHSSAMAAYEALFQPRSDEEDIVGEGDQLLLGEAASSHSSDFARWKVHLVHKQSDTFSAREDSNEG